MSTPLLLDTEAVLNIDLSGIKLIEASAGTGKTYTIANLYLRHVLQGIMPPNILVVTFTNAATEELRGRIRFRLFEALQLLRNNGKTDDDFLAQLSAVSKSQSAQQQQTRVQRLRHALAIMDQAAISTIHSFCQRLIQEHALPGQQYFESQLLVDDSELWQQAIKDWWRRNTYSLKRAEWLLLNDAIGGFASFAKQISDIRKKNSYDFLPQKVRPLSELFNDVYTVEPALRKLADQWQNFQNTAIDIIQSSVALSRSKSLPYHAENIEDFFSRLNNYFASGHLLPVTPELHYLRLSVLSDNSKKSKRGSDSNLGHDFFRAVDTVFEELESIVTLLRPAAFLSAIKDCREQVFRYKEANQKLSYDDLIDFTQRALHAATGKRLAAIIREQYPVAMIDEFQDTDHAQFNIFSKVYFNKSDISLTLIGDPKQAIYSFRGGDIFTYMLARQAPGVEHCALKTNWRSQYGLVNAVNHFFSNREDPFIYSNSIEFLPANAAQKNNESFLSVDGKKQAALTLWQIPSDQDLKPLNKETSGERLNAATAKEIVSLVKGGQSGSIGIEDNPLRAGDIAILVRTSAQGEAMRKALVSCGVSAIAIGREKVFNSDESAGLLLLLNTVAHPLNRRKLRLALASQLFNFDHLQMLDITGNELHWQNWIEDFKQLHDIWLTRGFIPMFQKMLQTFRLAEKLANRDQAERRLTNLLHLGELLQQQSLVSSGIDNLLNWFGQQQDDATDEAELRLESDDSLVKIITIHKSKGLEFPVVFLPYLWDCYPVDGKRKDPVYFHDDDFNAAIDLGSEAIGQHYLRADKERLAEDVRLLYVALTRARSKVYLAWGEAGSRTHSGSSSQTALAYLLHSTQTPEQLTFEPASGIPNAEAIPEALQTFVDKANGDIELKMLPEADLSDAVIENSPTAQSIQARIFHPKAQPGWRISSFSSLTRDIHQPPAMSDRDTSGDAILNFPAGSNIGLFLHALYEHLDFTGDIDAQCLDLVAQYAPRFGLKLDDRVKDLMHWVKQVVGTPLLQPGLKLSMLSNGQRLNELGFDFSLDRANIEEINWFFADRQNKPSFDITAHDFRGLITGVIDLVFEFDGKYYLADYKSNYLGNSLKDYSPQSLQQAMLDRRYDLQSLLYSLALHRYLRQRIKDYSYQDHFGGAYYLFLRAMRADSGSHFGVYFECPDETEIEMLDTLFSYRNTVLAL